jgi:hypothetical protein
MRASGSGRRLSEGKRRERYKRRRQFNRRDNRLRKGVLPNEPKRDRASPRLRDEPNRWLVRRTDGQLLPNEPNRDQASQPPLRNEPSLRLRNEANQRRGPRTGGLRLRNEPKRDQGRVRHRSRVLRNEAKRRSGVRTGDRRVLPNELNPQLNLATNQQTSLRHDGKTGGPFLPNEPKRSQASAPHLSRALWNELNLYHGRRTGVLLRNEANLRLRNDRRQHRLQRRNTRLLRPRMRIIIHPGRTRTNARTRASS